MNKFALIIIFMSGLSIQAQTTISRSVIGSMGSSSSTSFGDISFNVGEPAVKTFTGSGLELTQGFEQAPYAIEAPEFEFNTNNAFSPDEDGVNDYWVIPDIINHGSNRVTIVNRWGDKVREFENYNNNDQIWDGKNSSGQYVPEGTYYYVIELLDDDSAVTGWVQVTK